MNILYLSMSYSIKGSGLYQNLVEGLLNRGHKVTVVRSDSNLDKTTYENISEGFTVLNVKTMDVFSGNLIKKGLAQVSLPYYFKSAINKYLSKEHYDLILYATPPITLASVIDYCKGKYNAKAFLMLKDIFPQNAVDLGMMREDSLIHKYFVGQEKKYYAISDYIGCMSQGNVDYVIEHNPEVDTKKLDVFPNSVKIDREYKAIFNQDKTVFLFGGNLGRPQNIPLLLKVMYELKDYDKAKFVIVGDGTERAKIEKFLGENELSNVVYKTRVPQEEYEKMLETADVGLISLDPRFTIPNIPSKSQTYWKLGKPVLAVTDVNTDLKDMILDHKCGWWCDAANLEQIISIIKSICENKENQIEKGKNGYAYLKEDFDVEENVRKIEKFIVCC